MTAPGQPHRTIQPDDRELMRMVVEGEGRVPYMYLDSRGNVTVGIGQLLATPAAAGGLPFRHGSIGPPASRAEILAAWHRVKDSRGRVSSLRGYRDIGGLELPQSQIDTLFQRRVTEFTGQLRRAFPDFDTYPYDAQVALLDLAFNTGSVTPGRWPMLADAVRRRDWTTAASQSHRKPPVQKSRNDSTFARFTRAVAADSAAARPRVRP